MVSYLKVLLDDLYNHRIAWVDLELPSGNLWATCNLGASRPIDPGLYFAWGDVLGHSVRKDTDLTSDDFFFKREGYKDPNIIRGVLDLKNDAANTLLNRKWQIPNIDDIKELKSCCHFFWGVNDGIRGIYIRRSGKEIFVPAVGKCMDNCCFDEGYTGYYWTSTDVQIQPNTAFSFQFGFGTARASDYLRGEYVYYGLPIRPVCKLFKKP